MGRLAGSVLSVVTPVPAASVIVLRDGPLEVLLLRRSGQSSFVPGAWVFPGGVAEEGESLRDAAARVKLLRNGVLQYDQDIQLSAGSNAVSFRDRLSERGSHTYELLVESPDDTIAENNLLQGIVEVRGPPRVLLVSSQKPGQRFVSQVLKIQGYSVVEASPETHPLALSELSSFDLLVLDNVAASQLTHAKMESIEKYVRDLGGGLLVIGGSQSYGAGGYYRTPLERVLPVDMRPPARLDLPLRGDPLTLTLLSTAFLLGAIAIGVVIASVVRTLQQALFVAFFVLFPVLFLSGTITPVESMPPTLQTLSLLSPLRHYGDALLGVFLKGVGLGVLWPQLLAMIVQGGVLFGLALALFRRRLA